MSAPARTSTTTTTSAQYRPLRTEIAYLKGWTPSG